MNRLYRPTLGSLLLFLTIAVPPARAQDGLPADANAIPKEASNGATVVATDATWAPLDYDLTIKPGSVFDFSFMADAPAGKYGPVIVAPNGHFEFKKKPGVHATFWGVNICTQALYMEKDKCDEVADRLMRSGYNVVRIHHFDRDLLLPNANSYDIDPDKLDKLEYFVSALEKRGIYINFDLYSLRNFSDAEATAFGWPADRTTGFDRGRWFKATDAHFRCSVRFLEKVFAKSADARESLHRH